MSEILDEKNLLAPATPDEDISSLESSFTIGQYGVWRVLTPNSSAKLGDYWKGAIAGLGLLRVFWVDVWHVDPILCFGLILAQIWQGVQTSVSLYTSNRLLTAIEISITNGQANTRWILTATAAHILYMIFNAMMRWTTSEIKTQLKQRVQNHFGRLLFRANIAQDLATSQEHSSTQQSSPDDVWRAFMDSISFATLIFSTTSQLGFVLHVSRNDYCGPLFMASCIAMPIFNVLSEKSLWSKSYVIHSNNEHYVRLQSLRELIQGSYRKDIITGNLSEYLLDEYAKAQEALGSTSDDHAFYQFMRRATPLWDVSSDLLDTLPTIYYVANAIISPGGFSLASIAILQQTSYNLQWNFSRLLYDSKSSAETMNLIKKIYDSLEIKTQIHEGSVSYPSAGSTEEGMAIEGQTELNFQPFHSDLTFEYSGSKTTKKALSNVSFSIKPGQLVVIVGANGSGKSSLMKMLNRLYTPTSGTILVDGLPMSSYKISDLREATADLSQDHTLYPLTIRENIGLGLPAAMADMVEVRRAAEMGGALEFVEKFVDGFETTLQPVYTAMMGGPAGSESESISKKFFDKLEKQIDISGGEKQRLIASRTFMRLRSSKIRCCTVDEPSSALDPQGELELFQRLRDAKGGKTMFFVTHRFGHLTKHADVIICMKDGVVAEIGTHIELMSKAAEYANLYNIQAEAFSTSTAEES
ncbi:hypothetical protein HWV62_40625 [Athelia sp. TMB]|nr:hypothetical protein HWV62_2824 [Athelia sp. TMB]KAF7979862.1 hypothetical protein HWV62_40625 [Athelia sp. TMB]